MMSSYKIAKEPFIVPTTDGKLIQEIWGNSNDNASVSIAHMVAPPQWSEPFQTPEFEEYTYILRGRKQFEIDGETILLKAGESIRLQPGVRVRYSNPYDEECEYISVCRPAFSPELVNREEA